MLELQMMDILDFGTLNVGIFGFGTSKDENLEFENSIDRHLGFWKFEFWKF